MSIFPATDIVSDVANSADSRRLATGMERLRKLTVSRADTANATDATFDVYQGGNGERSRGVRFENVVGSQMRPPVKGSDFQNQPKSPGLVAAQKFEAFILQTWLEALLPKTEGGSFGTDGSANIWRSMMAEQLGTQLARSGGIGLQKIIATRQEGEVHGISASEPILSRTGVSQDNYIGESGPEKAL